MTGISMTGPALPTPQALFTGGAATGAPVVAADPASTVPVNGPTVAGPGGTTALPSAAPADFQSVNPTPLDQPHPQYPALIQSHVAVLQGIGTPEAVIAQIAGTQPSAEWMDAYIQGRIMQDPEGWDAFTQNPTGTARAGLEQLMPGYPLPAPGQGVPQPLPAGPSVDGMGGVPGVTQPLLTPEDDAGDGLVKGLLIAGAVAGVGLLAWKFLKNRNPAEDAVNLMKHTDDVKGIVGSSEGANGVRRLLENVIGGGGDDVVHGAQAMRALSMQATVGGSTLSTGTHAAATLESIMRGHGAANGFLNSTGASAVAFNQPFNKMAELALRSRALDIAEMAVANGTIGDLATAGVSLSQLSGAAAAGAGAKAGAVQQALAGVANALA